MNDRFARLRFAYACLKLARKELKDNGRQFMQPGESVYDSAMQYGGKLRLTKKEVVAVAKMNKERLAALHGRNLGK